MRFAASQLLSCVLLVLMLFALPGSAITLAANDLPLRLGVLTEHAHLSQQDWLKPLHETLEAGLNGRTVQLAVLDADGLEQALARNQLDLVLTNPAHMIQLEQRARLEPIATTLTQHGGQILGIFGGVMLLRAEQVPPRDLAALAKLRIASPEPRSLGGYLAQLGELQRAGVAINELNIVWTGLPHENAIRALLAGQADVAFVRSGVLESMIARGELAANQLQVFHRQLMPHFPHQVSTRLYPEWALAVLPWVDEATRRALALALLSRPLSNAANADGKLAGWSIAHNYQPVRELLAQLGQNTEDAHSPRPLLTAPGSALPLWLELALIVTLTLVLGLLLWLNRQLRRSLAEQADQHHELRDVNARFQSLTNNLQGAVYRRANDATWSFRYLSDGIEPLTGYPAARFMSGELLLTDLQFADDRPGIQLELDRALAEGRPFSLRYRLRHADGSIRWVRERGMLTHDGAQQESWLDGLMYDVTDVVRAEQALRDSEARLRKLTDEVPGALFQLALQAGGKARFPYCSRGITKLCGIAPEALAMDAEALLALFDASERSRLKRSIAAACSALQPWQGIYRFCDPARGERWLWLHATPERLEDGQFLFHGYLNDITERHQAEQALRASEEKLRITIAAVKDGLWEWRLDQKMINFDARCMEMLGYPPEARLLDQAQAKTLLHPEDRERVRLTIRTSLTCGDSDMRFEYRMLGADGQWHWLECRGQVVEREPNGRALRIVGTHSDIAARKAIEAELAQASRYQRALIERSGIAIIVSDEKLRITHANRRACELFGYRESELIDEELSILGGDDEAIGSSLAQVHAELFRHGQLDLTLPLLRHDRRPLHVALHASLLDPSDAHSDTIWVLQDVTAQHQATMELQRLATTDSLTNLLNRRVFLQQLSLELERQRRQQVRAGSLLMIDLDHFKQINDRYGHPAGDAALVHFARILRELVRRIDHAGRLGGEEFSVLLPGTPASGAQQFAERLREALHAEPLVHLGSHIPLTASIGVTELRDSDDRAETVIARADTALYRAKALGRDRVELA